jgi:hypothetical protein
MCQAVLRCDKIVPGGLTCEPGTVSHGSTGQAREAVMGLPFDQIVRQQRFSQDYPEWSIHAQDGPSFTAEKDDGAWRHIVAHPSLKGLLDRLDEIVAGR